jgi:serine/threonine protein kinase
MYGLQGAHDERPVSRHSVLHWTLSSQTRMVSQDVILHILDGMACGMAHIHDKNIIHGDLK